MDLPFGLAALTLAALAVLAPLSAGRSSTDGTAPCCTRCEPGCCDDCSDECEPGCCDACPQGCCAEQAEK